MLGDKPSVVSKVKFCESVCVAILARLLCYLKLLWSDLGLVKVVWWFLGWSLEMSLQGF